MIPTTNTKSPLPGASPPPRSAASSLPHQVNQAAVTLGEKFQLDLEQIVCIQLTWNA